MSKYPALFKSVGAYVHNKSVSFIVLILSFAIYYQLSQIAAANENGLPFLEICYAALSILTVAVAGPFLRLIVFNEAAQYAEEGRLDQDLKGCRFTPAFVHYWLSTGLCYLVCAACMATITK